MSRRKISTSRTSRFAGQSVTRTYAHDNGPSRTSRFLAFTGVSPWQPKRAAVSAFVFVWLTLSGQSAGLGVAFLIVSALVAAGVWAYRRRPVPVPPRVILPGPAWCDHCADWTVHPTGSHVAA